MHSTPAPAEIELVRRAAACSDEAFERLLDGHRHILRLTLSRHVTSREDREDVESEIVAGLLSDRKRALRAWRAVASFAAYLCTITARHAREWSRRHRRLNGGFLPALGPGPGGAESGSPILDIVAAPADEQPPAQLLRSENHAAVRRALSSLSPRDQVVLRLRFAHGLSGPAMGRTLGLTANAANQAVFRALRRLEQALEGAELAG